MVPFAGRMVTENIFCESALNNRVAKEYVRILINDAVQPLHFCNGVQGLFYSLQLEAAIPFRLPFDFMERAAQESAREIQGLSDP